MIVTFLRSAITALLFIGFLALWFWAWGKGRRADFDAAARLPFDEGHERSGQP